MFARPALLNRQALIARKRDAAARGALGLGGNDILPEACPGGGMLR